MCWRRVTYTFLCILVVVYSGGGALGQRRKGGSWSGIEVIDLTATLKEKYRLIPPVGALVTKVYKDGPAYGLDLKEGDLITLANGNPIVGKDGLENAIEELAPGKSMTLIRARESQIAEVVVTLASPRRSPQDDAVEAKKQKEPEKLALLIGNKDYMNEDLRGLINPLNDIARMEETVGKLGFRIIQRVNNAPDHDTMLSAVQNFAAALKDAGKDAIGLFYYSGHGLSPDGKTNYLLPTNIRDTSQKSVRAQALSLDDITHELQEQAPDARHIVVFDACRDIAGLKGGGPTFTYPAVDKGMLIAFSAKPGGRAKDKLKGIEGAGPYATVLTEELEVPGRNISDVFDAVHRRIFELSGSEQEPWIAESPGVSRSVHLNGYLTWEEQHRLDGDAKRFARDSVAATDGGDSVVGVLLALEPLPKDDASDLEWSLANPALFALDWAMRNLNLRALLKGRYLAISPDGKTIVTESHDFTARLWDAASGQPRGELTGHTGAVTAAEFSPDGKTIVTTSLDKTGRLWDAASGQPRGELKGHTDVVTKAVFSPDGETIVTVSRDRTARLWDAASGQPRAELKGHADVDYAVFSPDSKTVVTTSLRDFTKRLWDAASGQPRAELEGHTGAVTVAEFSPDSKTIVTASKNDWTARLWDVASGQPRGELKGHRGEVNYAEFSPDGKTIVTASDDTTARLWDVASGQLRGELRGHGSAVESAAFSPDGKTIVTTTSLDRTLEGTARLWDAASGKPRGELIKGDTSVMNAEFSPDGKTIMTVTGYTARLWDAATGQPRGELKAHGFKSAAFSADGKTIVTAANDAALLWDVPHGELKGHTGPVWSAAFSPDGKTIVTASLDGTARLWDAASGQPRGKLMGHEGIVTSAAFSPDGKTIVTVYETASPYMRSARLWDAASGQPRGQLMGHTGRVESVAFSRDGKTIVTASGDTTARLWDVASGQPRGELKGHTHAVISAAFSPDGKTVVTGSDDWTARLWDVASGQPRGQLRGHTGGVESVAFSPDGKTIVTASGDTTARLWDVASGQPRGELRNTGEHAAFSPDGKTIVTTSVHGAQLWDAASGQLRGELKGHTDEVYSAAFSPDGKTIVTASRDGTARLWDVASGQPRGQLRGHGSAVESAAFSPDGKTIVTASYDGTARLWAVLPTRIELARLAREKIPVCLTRQARERYALSEAIPSWCKEMKKWQYDDGAWRERELSLGPAN